jgi:threonine dehydrogenase-like Zn-dependent dehydrogenase
MIPIKYLVGGIGLIGIIATAYFAVSHYNSVIADNQKLKTEIASVRAERDTYQRITETQSHIDQHTREIVEKTKVITNEIRSKPITQECVSSPSVSTALDSLRSAAAQP